MYFTCGAIGNQRVFKKLARTFCAVLVVFLAERKAFSQSTTSSTQTGLGNNRTVAVKKQLSIREQLKDKLIVSYFSVVYGPTVDGQNRFVDPNGDTFVETGLFNTVNVRYHLSKNWAIASQTQFESMVREKDYFRFHTQRFGIFTNQNITEEFAFFGQLNSDVRGLHSQDYGALRNTQDQNFFLSPGVIGGLTYSPKNSRLSAALWMGPRLFIFQDPKENSRQANIYVGPMLNYRLSSKLQATLTSDFFWAKRRNTAFVRDPLNIYPGIEWAISQEVNIMPYVNFWIPTESAKITASNTSIGMWISGRLF